MSKHRWSRWPAIALLGAVAVLVPACSSNGEVTMPDDVNIGTLPPVDTGATCTDPVGDISDLTSEVAGSMSDPAGIDIVSVTADIDDTNLTVTYTVAGPIASVSEAEFLLSQGVSGQEPSFEIRAKATSAGGSMGLELITFEKSNGRVVEAPAKPLSAPVTVDGSVLTYTVPLTELPRIVTLIWQFGASGLRAPQPPSTETVRVLDDCNNMGDQKAAPGTSSSLAPTTTVPRVALGVPLTHRSGAIVTIDQVQNPPATLEALPIPPDEGNVPAVVHAQVCAGEQPLTARAGAFGIQTSAGEIRTIWDAPQSATVPAFPASETLAPHACTTGWITFQLPATDQIVEAFYSPDSDGSDYIIWTVPPR